MTWLSTFKMCSCRGKRRRMARKKNNANKRAKTSSDYSINSINSSLNSLNSSLNRLNLDRYNSSSERTSDRYSSTSSILGSSSSSLTGRSSTHRRLPPLESNALGSSINLYPSSGSELRSSRSVRSSISSRSKLGFLNRLVLCQAHSKAKRPMIP